MADLTFEQGGFTYRAGKLTALQQFHVMRRLTPLIEDLKPLVLTMGNGERPKEEDAIAAILMGIGKLRDEDCNFVFAACLGVTQRSVNGAWASMWPRGATQPAYDDLSLPDMIALTIKCVQANLAGFMPALGLTSAGQGDGSSPTK